ncbi:MAG TPA: aldehyde ferredoxin oxidoreductase family protein [Symbiobacteriaceae bacterium]|nr:aldehyde ferredoxin oxidoreductase family protein [Symbiobacteriaceae bacterium]
MPKGYMGKVLWVDLTNRTVVEETLPDWVYRQFLGGYGLGVKILYDRMQPGTDPLGSENILGFVPGLLTGTGTPFSGRFSVVCKSPLTGGWGDANCGGFFGPELRRCGYDGLFVTGSAAEPTYITLHKGNVEFHPAGELWGRHAPDCEEELKHRYGANWQVACIGPAGENLSLISGIVNDRGRLAARSGVGAVMGSKRLKAIVCRGHLPVSKADVEAFKASTQAIMAKMHPMEPEPKGLLNQLMVKVPGLAGKWIGRLGLHIKAPHPTVVWSMANQGTTSVLAVSTESGDAPIKNWRGVGMRDFPYERAKQISDVKATQFNTGFYACSACPLHCGGEIRLDDPEFQIAEGHRVEYESLAGLGANLLIDSMKEIQYGHHLCNLYGLDVISTAVVIAFAFECYERGLIGIDQTGGIPLVWGDGRAMLALIEMIAHRRLIGAVLADGVKRAASLIGHGAEAFAMHAGGQELPFHDPRLTPSFATTYLTDPTPGRHTAGGAHTLEVAYANPPFPVEVQKVLRWDFAGKGPAHAIMTQTKQVQQAVGLCEFSDHAGSFPYELMIKGACGWELTSDELLRIGDRIQTLRHAFNAREGIRPGDWQLPDRTVGRPPLTEGPTRGVTVDVEAMAGAYFAAMEIDPETGYPAEAKLRNLGLDSVAEDLYHGFRARQRLAGDHA